MRRFWMAAVILLAAACADEIPEDVSEQMEAARVAREAESDTATAPPNLDDLLRTAPPGGHVEWIRDIRVGLDSITIEAELDRGGALHRVQELFTRRFEPLRIFFGADGAIDAGADMSRAVEGAGTQIQELMRQLASNASDAAAIEQAVAAARDAVDQIETAARAAGLSTTAPRDAFTTTE